MDTEWRAVVGYEGRYEVSDDGRIRSLLHRGQPRQRPLGLPGQTDDRGYNSVLLTGNDGKMKRKMVHRLILEAFVGPCPDGMECGHLDGNPYHNQVGNLKWVTKAENMRHRDEHGTTSCGESRPLSVFTEEEVRLLRQMHAAGFKRGDLVTLAVKKTGCDPTVARDILGFRTWKRVK